MSDIPEEPVITPPSHLKSYMSEIMASLRMRSMELLLEELLCAFAEENYRLDEFIFALADYSECQPGWEKVARHLELASSELAKIRRESGEETDSTLPIAN